MPTNRDVLLAITGYPVPMRTVEMVSVKRGISLDTPATRDGMRSADYKLAEADLLLWLFRAPNVSQGGQSYSFTADQRQMLRKRALDLYGKYGTAEDVAQLGVTYGYKGTRL